jgi:hypothetical protein
VVFAPGRGHECRKSGTISDEKIVVTSGQNGDPAPESLFAAAAKLPCMAWPEGYGRPRAKVTKALQPAAGRCADLS